MILRAREKAPYALKATVYSGKSRDCNVLIITNKLYDFRCRRCFFTPKVYIDTPSEGKSALCAKSNSLFGEIKGKAT